MTPGSLRLAAGAVIAALLWGSNPALAATAPSLGEAESFAVLGGSTVTNTGSTVVNGSLGVSPGSSVTGFPPGIVNGFTHIADAVAAGAQDDVTTAYNALAGQACNEDLTGQDLGGLTLTAGVYCFSSSAQLTGTLTLDAEGDPNAVFIFQIGSTLTTASNSDVDLINGADPCNVFWQVGSSATLGTTTDFVGNILALTSITLNTGADVEGRVLARNGAVTLDDNDVTATCAAPPICPEIELAPATLPNGTVGVAYLQTITGTGGTAPYTFEVVSGTLPAGLTLNTAGQLSGTPTGAGSSNFTIRGTDANDCFAELAYTIVILAAPEPPGECPKITLSPPTLPDGTVGVAYLQTITGSGGAAPFSFGVVSGTLPAGLTLSASGVLSGTPTTDGSSTFTIRGTDANGCFEEIEYTIEIAEAPQPPGNCPPITLSPATLPNGTYGEPYSQQLTGSGGTEPYSFGVVAGALPPGLTLTPGGLISGTPVLALPSSASAKSFTASKRGTGRTPFARDGKDPSHSIAELGVVSEANTLVTIRGTDANGCFAEITYLIDIRPAAVPTLPQLFVLLLAFGLSGIGFFQLRRRARAD